MWFTVSLCLLLVPIAWVAMTRFSNNGVAFFPSIPILPGYPFIGTAILLVPIFGLRSHFQILELIETYGSICQCLLLGKHCLMIHDPKVIKVAMEKVKGKGDIHQRIFSAVNIFSSDTNHEWKQRRQAFRHAFNPVNLRHFTENLESISTRFCSILDDNAKNKSIVYIDELLGRFALDVIFNVGLQWDRNFLHNKDLYDKLNKGVQGMFEYLWVPHLPLLGYFSTWNLPFYPYKQYSQAASTIREFQVDILQHLQHKHEKGELAAGSFGKILIEFGEEYHLTTEELLSEILVFIVAGHETTAHTLSWIIYALCRDTQLQEKCHDIMAHHCNLENAGNADQDKELSGPASGKSFAILPEYIEAVIKEAMRKYPTASRGSFRVVNDENGIDLPIGLANDMTSLNKRYPDIIHLSKGTWIGVNFFAAHHLKSVWGEDALEFRPERWLRDSEKDEMLVKENDRNSPASFAGVGKNSDMIAFLPFAYGPRNCIGMNMAIWEIRTVLKAVLTKYQFRFVDPKFMDESHVLQTDITLKPIQQLPIYVDMP